jgi:hypothetical protein
MFSIVIPEEDESIEEVKDLYSDNSNITIDPVARFIPWYPEWMVDSYFEENFQLTHDFFQNTQNCKLSNSYFLCFLGFFWNSTLSSVFHFLFNCL